MGKVGMALAPAVEPRDRGVVIPTAVFLERALAVAVQLVNDGTVVGVEILALLSGPVDVAIRFAVEPTKPLLKAVLLAPDERVDVLGRSVPVSLQDVEYVEV